QADWGAPALRWRPVAGTRHVKCGNLMVDVSANPFAIRVAQKGGRVVQELKLDTATGKLTFELGDSPVLGLGQGGPQFDRRGSIDRMGNGQGAYRLATHGARVPVQFAIGTGGWAMYVHQPLGVFDLTGKEGIFQTPNPESALPLDLFVIGSGTPAAILSEYAKITGYAEMPPLWSLGYQQSHRTLGSPDQILAEARAFREKKLPCDAMIYLGTGFCPNGWNTDNGEFGWNPKAFPDPKAAIQQLHDEHFQVVLHIVVEGRRYSGTVRELCTAPSQPTGRTPDGHWPEDRQVSCYWPAHKPLLDLGVDGWWPDQGDGFDAPSRLARNRMYFEGQQMYRPNQRVYALHRNGYAGMQRYASFLWSGDVQSTWETLKTHVPVGVNTGLSGIPYWGTDIGGFIPTREYTGELYLRWFQFAAFCPLFRSHGRVWTLHLPWGWNMGDPSPLVRQETPRYQPDPSELHNAAIEPICKKYLELRYQLMPYLYAAVKETCETGMPIMRALWLHYADDAGAVARGDEYLYGREILVAPVVEKGAATRSLYLPRGVWYDFWTKERLEGGRQIERKVDLETIPLYVRAGAVIPMGPVKQYTGENVAAPLSLWVHPGEDGAFSLYEDDGKSFDYRKGEFTRVNFAWNDRKRRLSARLASGSKMLASATRNFVVHVAGESVTREFVFQGRPVEVKL
ncbi:MAG TPA: TIM-barrel domain-containing protein, partial [Bryobacteraceae bacterium]|nr:TIM-barrel domain-containing protein [Bryobacteraceae bacterium]